MMKATTGRTPDFDTTTPLRTDADVLRRIDELLDTDARTQRSVWLMFLDPDGAQMPVLTVIDDVPARPDDLTVGSLSSIIAHLFRDDGSDGSAVVVLTGATDRAVADNFARTLRATAREHKAAVRMVCLATPAGVRPI